MENRDLIVKKVGKLGIFANLFLLVIKLIIGLMCKSQAMIADSINSAGDIFASGMSYIGSKLSSKPKDEDHPYGHGKAEYIFSFLISLSMVVAALVMFNNSIISILQKKEIHFSIWLIIVSVVTIITKILLFVYTKYKYKKCKSVLIRACMEDHRNDIVITTATLISIIFSVFHIYIVDGIVGCLISIWIGYVGVKLFYDSYRVLMDTTMSKATQDEIVSMIKKYPEILHVDSITTKPVGDRFVVILKISMNGDKTLFECHDISGKLKFDIMQRFEEAYDVVIHINPH